MAVVVVILELASVRAGNSFAKQGSVRFAFWACPVDCPRKEGIYERGVIPIGAELRERERNASRFTGIGEGLKWRGFRVTLGIPRFVRKRVYTLFHFTVCIARWRELLSIVVKSERQSCNHRVNRVMAKRFSVQRVEII